MRRRHLLWLIVTVALLGLTDEETKRIVYYDPDVNPQAMLEVSAWLNEYFSSRMILVTVQPLQSESKLGELLRDDRTAFAIVHSSFLRRNPKSPLRPIAIPALKGQTSYRKLLVDRGEGEPGDLRGKTVAVTSTDADRDDLALLRHVKSIRLEDTIVVSVGKDIDALLGLSFKAVDAAIVTPTSVDFLGRINPVAAKSLRVVFETPEIRRAPLCAHLGRSRPADRRVVLDAFTRMSEDAQGSRLLSAISLDEWRPVGGELLQ